MLHINKNNINKFDIFVDMMSYSYVEIRDIDFYSKTFYNMMTKIINTEYNEDKIINIQINCNIGKLTIVNNIDTNNLLLTNCSYRYESEDCIIDNIKFINIFNDMIIVDDNYFNNKIETRFDEHDMNVLLSFSAYSWKENNENGLYLFSYRFEKEEIDLKINLIYNL